MDKKNTIRTSDFYVGQLVLKLAIRFGFTAIRSRDCHYMSEEIKRFQPLEPVSEKTLMRIIGVDKTFPNLSVNSLDYLARFLGYLHFEAFVKNIKEEKGVGNVPMSFDDQKGFTHKGINPFLRILSIKEVPDFSFETVSAYCSTHHENYYLYTHILPQIIESAFQKEDFEFLSRFFDLPYIFTEKNYMHFQLWSLSQHFGIALRKHEKLRETLLPIYATHPVAQSFYFEFFVDTDYLVLHHHKAIELYLEQKKTDEARLFGHSLLFLKSFLSKNEADCKRHIEELRIIPKTAQIHIIPTVRYYGSELIYRHFYGGGISDDYWELILQMARLAHTYPNFDDKPLHFHIKILNALLLCSEWAKLVWYVTHILLADYDLDELKESQDFYLKKLWMYYALCTHLQQNETLAQKLFKQIKPLQDTDYEREFEHLHYLIVKNIIVKDVNTTNEGMSIAKKLKYAFFEDVFRSNNL